MHRTVPARLHMILCILESTYTQEENMHGLRVGREGIQAEREPNFINFSLRRPWDV